MGINTHLEEEKKELAKDVHRLARKRVRLMDSKNGGIVVTNESALSLMPKVKGKHDQDPIFLEMKENVHKQRVLDFEQEGDGVLK